MIGKSAVDLLSRESLEITTREFANDPEVIRRLAWWLRHGHSCERWFQFEWTYRLAVRASRFFEVGCEYRRIDVAILEKSAGGSNDIKAGIELKWFGNWWRGSSFDVFRLDIEKIKRYQFPAVALAVWLVARPKQHAEAYNWLRSQVAEGRGFKDGGAIRAGMIEAIGTDPDIEFSLTCTDHNDFEDLEIRAFGFHNAA